MALAELEAASAIADAVRREAGTLAHAVALTIVLAVEALRQRLRPFTERQQPATPAVPHTAIATVTGLGASEDVLNSSRGDAMQIDVGISNTENTVVDVGGGIGGTNAGSKRPDGGNSDGHIGADGVNFTALLARPAIRKHTFDFLAAGTGCT